MTLLHTVTADHRVVTTGSTDQPIASTSWPDRASARAYAWRIATLCTGDVIEEPLLALVKS